MAGTVIQAFIFKDGAFVGTEMLSGVRIDIGRDASASMMLDDDDLISRLHARLVVEGQQLFIEDLASANGTAVNGEPLDDRRLLGPRDDVFIGHYAIKFKLLNSVPAPAPRAPAAPPTQGETKVHNFAQDQTLAVPRPVPRSKPLPTNMVQPRPSQVERAFSEPASSAAADPFQTPQSFGDELFNDVSGINSAAPANAASIADDPIFGGPTEPARSAQELAEMAAEPAITPAHRATALPKPAPSAASASATTQAFAPAAASQAQAQVQAQAKAIPTASAASVVAAAVPAPAPAPARSLAPLPLPDDEDFDPDDQPAPFSLLENLLKENFKDGRVKQIRKPCLEVIRYHQDTIDEMRSLDIGQTLMLGEGLAKKEAQSLGLPVNFKLAKMRRNGEADLALRREFVGKVRSAGHSRPLADAANWKGDKGLLRLKAGDLASVQISNENYFLRFAYPPAVTREITSRGKANSEQKDELRWLGLGFLSSGGGHLAILLAFFIVGLISPSQVVTQLEADRFVQVEMDELKLEKPEEEPPPVEEPPEEAPPEEKAPEPEVQPKKRQARQRLSHPSGKTKKPGILAALGKIPKRSGAAGSQTLTAAVSNLDAVKVPGGGASYKVSGLIGKGPSKRVQIGGSGGGVATKGLASILREGGGGPGTLSKIKKRRVRGRVVKASRSAKTRGTGILNRAEIQKVVNKGLGQIQFCYEKELLKNQSLSGKVSFQWTISTSGRVSIVKTKTSTLRSNAAVQCMIRKIKTWKFPKPRGNGTVIVTYPFIFNAMGF